jgi:hypothetical protein
MSAARRPADQPWSMKWIVLAIALFVVGYTLVNFYYRKPGRAFQPYEDMNKRATTARLLQAGWQKLPVEVARPLEKVAPGSSAATTRGAFGPGVELAAAFAEPLVLFATIDQVTAPATIARGETYRVHFVASLTDQHLQLDRIEALRRGQEIVLIPALEKLPGEKLLSRWKDADYVAQFSTERLEPGRYTVRLAATGPALQWALDVR